MFKRVELAIDNPISFQNSITYAKKFRSITSLYVDLVHKKDAHWVSANKVKVVLHIYP